MTRWRHGGWSKDCIWISSSFTIPEPAGPKNEDTLRPGACPIPSRGLDKNGSGDIANPLRSPPIASISSMKPIAPPSRRAAFRSALKKERILMFVIPYHIDWKAGAETNRNGTPACLAIALARNVFPVPGGPSNRMPRRGFPPRTSRKVA